MSRDYRTLTEVWDRKEFKLAVLVVEASGLSVGGQEAVSPFVRVSVGKSTHVTKTVKASSDPVFKDFVFHTVNSIQTCLGLTFEVWSATKLGKDRFLGMASLEVLRLLPETCYDFWLTLQARPEERRRSSLSVISLRSSHSEVVSGKLRVRVLLSSMSGSRPRVGPLVQNYAYDYDHVNFKTGDVLAFSGVGMLPTLTKLLSNSEVSSLGIVLFLPNLYTQRLEPYVAEVTPNSDGMIDAFLERPKRAVCVFRLFERLHQFHGGNIRVYPLKNEVKLEMVEKMMSWIWQVHTKGGLPLDLVGPQVQFIKKELGFKLERPEIQAELSELSSSLFVVRCLSLCGQLSSDALSQIGGLPAFVLQLSCFAEPIPLRTWIPDPKSILSTQPYPALLQTVAGSPRTDGSSAPMSPSLTGGSLRRGTNGSLQQQATAASAAAVSLSANSSAASSPSMSRPPTRKPSGASTPPAKPAILSRQISTLSFNPSSNVLPEEADVLTVDVDSLINDLRAVELETRATHEDSLVDEEKEEEEDERSPSSSPPKSWGGSFGRRSSTPRSAGEAASAAAIPEEHEEPVFDELPDLSDLNVDNLDLGLLGPPPTVTLAVPVVPALDPQAEIVLNLVNYLPGMELVRFSDGLISIDDASSLIRYKHEVLGGLFWNFSDLTTCIKTLGINDKLLESFRKPPFPADVLSLLAPQVARGVRCEPLFDGACYSHLIDAVTSARSFVCLSIPELHAGALSSALALAAGRGVQVRVILGTQQDADASQVGKTCLFIRLSVSLSPFLSLKIE
jgi:hypothetical protein